ncbi:serine/threonine-protein phosphatase 6 regulatory ankyrin repeat subunit B-like [Haliotis rubra]|uniref:serine/threonine-protein phosphatase 6 regulatory ankyrin repeat subunit B-like n=1 Tax=Haliotis rubra TaxID=36100 RepID=UPI001EE553A4|nr:serine/threonine-protein phosphatase 6 regulatory ankyrin repeat subunit B-like [Haliotis rubra]
MWMIGIVVCLYSFTVNGNEECIPGTFGADCNQICSQNCYIPPNTELHCDIEDGTCHEGCNVGFYGDRCDQRCSKNCKELICYQINGHCSEGCIDNHIGDFCEIAQDPPPVLTGTTNDVPTTVTTTVIPPRRTSSETVAITVIIPVVVVVLVLVVTVCIILTRCRKRKTHRKSDPEVGQELLQDIKSRDSRRDDTALHDACRRGTLAEVRQMISEDPVNINSRGKCGWTPVMIAADGGRQELVDLLVRQRCDLSLTDDDGNTILHVASIKGHWKTVRYILSKKTVDVNITGHCNRTAVMAAARFGHRKVFDLLVKNGSDLSTVDSDENNILHIACIGGHVEIVKYILKNGFGDINSRGHNRRTPVMLAANSGHIQVFELLVGKECLLRTKDRNGTGILHFACVGNNVEIVDGILKRNIVSIDSKDGDGKTPVMLAAEFGHTDMFTFLVDNQCDTQVVCEKGNNVLHTSCALGHVDIVKCILTQGPVNVDSCGQNQMTPVMLAAKNGHRDIFDLLLNNGCDTSQLDKDGNTVLHMACYGGSKYIVEDILSKELVGINSRGQSQRTPAMVAAACGNQEVFDLLFNRGADLTLADCDDFGILHLIAMGGHLQMMEHVKNIIDCR